LVSLRDPADPPRTVVPLAPILKAGFNGRHLPRRVLFLRVRPRQILFRGLLLRHVLFPRDLSPAYPFFTTWSVIIIYNAKMAVKRRGGSAHPPGDAARDGPDPAIAGGEPDAN